MDVSFFVNNMSVNGVSRWVQTLSRDLPSRGVNVTDVVIPAHAPLSHGFLNGIMQGGIRMRAYDSATLEAVTREVVRDCEVCIMHRTALPIHDVMKTITGLKTVGVSHGPNPETRDWIEDAGHTLKHYAAVSQGCLSNFYKDAYVEVIPNGADTTLYGQEIDPSFARNQLGLPNNITIGYIGRFDLSKDPITVARVAKILQNKFGVPIKCLYVGSGPHEAAIKSAAQSASPGQCTFVTPRSTDLSLYYSALDCLVFTSPVEGSPMVIKEAMMMGTPIVCTEVGDIPDMQRDHGQLFSSVPVSEATPERVADLCEYALGESGLDLAVSARQVALTTFSSETMADQWAEYLKGL